MTREELIKRAALMYPIGTKYKDLNCGEIYEADTSPKWIGNGADYIHVRFGGGLVFKNGKWAEIVSTPSSSYLIFN